MPPLKHGIAVVQQVMHGDRRRNVGRRGRDELDGLARGDVFQHDFQFGKVTQQAGEMALDEHRFAVEHIDIGIDHFAMQQQWHPDFFHRRNGLVGLGQFGHAGIGIRRGAGRVILHRVHQAACARAADFIGLHVVGEIKRHQRLERRATCCRKQTRAIRGCICHVNDRWDEIGHGDGAAEHPRSVGQQALHGGAIAKVNVPVVWAGNRESVGHGSACGFNARVIL